MCSKKLKAAIPLWLPFYEGEFEPLADHVQQKLLTISPATIDRLRKPVRALDKKGRCSTKPGTLLKNQIPVKTHNWDSTDQGFSRRIRLPIAAIPWPEKGQDLDQLTN